MKRGTSTHPKIEDLADRLNIARSWAAGIVVSMWDWAAEYTPAGDVGKYPNQTIAKNVGFPVERADELIEKLLLSRWLDKSETHRVIIHDWPDHCEDTVHARLARAKQWFASGEAPKITKLSGDEREAARVFYAKGLRQRKSGGQKPPKAANGGLPPPIPIPPPIPPPAPRQAAAGSRQVECALISDFYGRWLGPNVKPPTFTAAEVEFAAEVIAEAGGLEQARRLQVGVVEDMRKSFPKADRFRASEAAWRKKLGGVTAHRKAEERSATEREKREAEQRRALQTEAENKAIAERVRPKWEALPQSERQRFLAKLPPPFRENEIVVLTMFSDSLTAAQ